MEKIVEQEYIARKLLNLYLKVFVIFFNINNNNIY